MLKVASRRVSQAEDLILIALIEAYISSTGQLPIMLNCNSQ